MNCDLYRKTVNGRDQADFCISPVFRGRIDPDDFDRARSVLGIRRPAVVLHIVPHLDDMDWGRHASRFGFSGIPLDVVTYDHGKPDIEQTVTKVERAAIRPASFELPPGLTKQDFTTAVH